MLKIWYDTESTGLAVATIDMVEIAAMNDSDTTKEFNQLIYSKYIPSFVSQVHGITTEMVKNEPHITEVLIKFTDWVELQHKEYAQAQQTDVDSIKLVLIAHNGLRFDNKLLKRLVTQFLPPEYQEKWKKWYFADTLAAIKQSHPQHTSNGLDNLTKLYVKSDKFPNFSSRHRALYDVLIMREMFYNLPNHAEASKLLIEQMISFEEFQWCKPTKKRKATIIATEEIPEVVQAKTKEEQTDVMVEGRIDLNQAESLKSLIHLLIEHDEKETRFTKEFFDSYIESKKQRMKLLEEMVKVLNTDPTSRSKHPIESFALATNQ